MGKNVLEEMLDAYQDLRRSLSRELGNGQDAADLAQSSFEQALRYSQTNAVSSPRGLLFRMARNIRIDGLRRERRFATDSLDETNEEQVPSTLQSELSPERVLLGKQSLSRVAMAFEALPPRCREAFTLNRSQGLSYEEVAEAMGISVSQVEKYMVRSLRVCRDALDE